MNKIILTYWKQYLLNLTPILRKVLGHKIPANEKVYNNSNKNATTMRYHLTPIRMVIIKKPTGLPWWRSGWESACQCRGHWFEP